MEDTEEKKKKNRETWRPSDAHRLELKKSAEGMSESVLCEEGCLCKQQGRFLDQNYCLHHTFLLSNFVFSDQSSSVLMHLN